MLIPHSNFRNPQSKPFDCSKTVPYRTLPGPPYKARSKTSHVSNTHQTKFNMITQVNSGESIMDKLGRVLCSAAMLAVCGASPVDFARADHWPQWRGPNNDGVSLETGIATRWSRTENIAWRVPLPGPAAATPVVWGQQIFLTTVDGDNLDLLCIRTDGKQLWRRTLGQGNRNVRGDEGNFASPSPSTDGKSVWAFMCNGELACYDQSKTTLKQYTTTT